MQIKQVGMTRSHYQLGELQRIRMVVVHSTAGRKPGDYNWLRDGGSKENPVSVHYYIDKAGNISQMVDDKNIAWHAGVSKWTVDGQVVNGCNAISLGIELENLNNGRDPYPEAQYNATLDLVRHLVKTFNIPRNQLVRHLDISPGRKTDPAGFTWERFVAQVYEHDLAIPSKSSVPHKAPLEPLAPTQPLRTLLLDLAYRAAGSAYAAGWQLLKETVAQNTGMPVLTFHPSSQLHGQDDTNRHITVLGQQLVLEAYGRDLYYLDESDQIKRLSETAPGDLREALLKVLFQAVDPIKGYRPDQSFHAYYQSHISELGVPIGPDHMLPGSKTVSCQHYSLDSLIWNGKLMRLSELTKDMYGTDTHDQATKDLRTQVLDDLYLTRTGRKFDRSALFCQYAVKHNLGAPIAKAEQVQLDSYQLVAIPYALDTIYCRIPDDGDWRNVVVGQLPAVLGDEPELSLLSQLLQEAEFGNGQVLSGNEQVEAIPTQIFLGGLLANEAPVPTQVDLRHNYPSHLSRGDSAISNIVIFPRTQSIYQDFATTSTDAPWHYYIDLTGQLYQLGNEESLHKRSCGKTSHSATTP